MPASLPGPCYIISDTHLGVASPATERELTTFLRSLAGRAASLLINGDLFDFWFEWRTVIPRVGFRTLAALADLRDRGVEVLWVAGNHDCWGGDVLRRDVGLEYRVGEWTGCIAGWKALVAHGDGLRAREDRRYRALRGLLRNPAAVAVFKLVHPDLGSRLAKSSSHASRTYRARDGGAGLRAIAYARLAASPELDLVVYGHSHVPALEQAPTGGAYGNAGSWLDSPTFLRVTGGHVELREWDGSSEGKRLDTVDRAAEKALRQGEELRGRV